MFRSLLIDCVSFNLWIEGQQLRSRCNGNESQPGVTVEPLWSLRLVWKNLHTYLAVQLAIYLLILRPLDCAQRRARNAGGKTPLTVFSMGLRAGARVLTLNLGYHVLIRLFLAALAMQVACPADSTGAVSWSSGLSIEARHDSLREAWLDFHPPSDVLLRVSHSMTYPTLLMLLSSPSLGEAALWEGGNWLVFRVINDLAHEYGSSVPGEELGAAATRNCMRFLYETEELCRGADFKAQRFLFAAPMNMWYTVTGFRRATASMNVCATCDGVAIE